MQSTQIIRKSLLTIALILFSFTNLIFGQESITTQNYTTPKKVIIAGQVKNHNKQIKSVSISLNRVGFRHHPVTKYPKIDSLGNFHTSIECYVPSDLWVDYKTNFLIVAHPGDSIYLTFDGSTGNRPELLETVTFSGDNAKSNEEVAQIQKIYYSTSIFNPLDEKAETDLNYRNTRFMEDIDSVCNALYQEVIEKVNPSKEVQHWAKMFISGKYLMRSSFHNDGLLKKIPNSIEDFYAGSDINNLINLFENYTHFKAREDPINKAYDTLTITNYEEFKQALRRVDSIAAYKPTKYMPAGLLQQAVITTIFQRKLHEKDTTFFNNYRDVVENFVKEPFLYKPLLNLYNQVVEDLKAPEIATAKILSELEGTKVNDIIKEILKENKGKVIYIDCWGTWCAPCIAEMHKSKALAKELTDKDVAFVYLCFNSNYEDWQKKVASINTGGKHYLLTREESNELAEALNIFGYPNYVLINKRGNIVDKGIHLTPDEAKEKILEMEKEPLLFPLKQFTID